MKLPVMPPITPMLAQIADEIPEGDYQYEPKWDGFRAMVFRDGNELEILSRHGRPLGRYFPELVQGLSKTLPRRCVVDGEIVIAGEHGLDFDALLLRLHPAASRIARLARETPAQLVVFDILAHGDKDVRTRPLHRRRAALAKILAGAEAPLHLTPMTSELAVAQDWFERFEGAGLDGVIAKPLELPYVAGERVMTKIKHQRTADCVVGGFRRGKDGRSVASLLLGLYDRARKLHFVGFASGFAASRRKDFEAKLEPYRQDAEQSHPWLAAGADGQYRIPGGPSRWSGDRDMAWEPLRPELVVEVAYDHLQGDRFRHATRFVRWRSDRTPRSCTYAQLESTPPAELAEILGISHHRAA